MREAGKKMPLQAQEESIKVERLRILAFFGALCLFFSAVENVLPRPLPFFRVGLSNIPVLLALDFMPFGSLALLVAVKVLGQGLIGGTLISYIFAFSAAGAAASFLCMYPLHRLCGRRISPIGLASAGALASNLVQVALSITFIFGPTALVIAPALLGIGCVSGLLMGAFALAFRDRSRWLQDISLRWRGTRP